MTQQNLTNKHTYIIMVCYIPSSKNNLLKHTCYIIKYSSVRTVLLKNVHRLLSAANVGFFYKSHSERSLWISELHIPGEMRCTPFCRLNAPCNNIAPQQAASLCLSARGSEKLSFFMCRLVRSGWEARIVRLPYSAKCSC